ncbi:MAG: amidase [Streptosporangiales bacterium]|nr:amidase [Streptosporangiales bacterium]
MTGNAGNPAPEPAAHLADPADPAGLTAAELAAAYRAGALSPVEATAAVLARIEREDSKVNAYCLVDTEGAMSAARAAEDRLRRGDPLGTLDGVPVSIKDILLTRGLPTLRGSRTVDPDGPWPEDAPSVARLREQGAVAVGKTTSPELGWKGVTDSPLTGVTRNPWDPSRTAGGSSGGAAAAVALGMAPLALGTDGGGSVRIPAAFCGIFTIKPTYGRVPHYPASPFGTLAHVGPMTRSVTDAALLLDVISRPDPRDWSAMPPPVVSYAAELDRPMAGLRIAFSLDLGFVTVDPDIATLVEAAAEVFAELGATVERADPGFDDPVEDFHTLWFSGAAKSLEAIPEGRRAEMDPGLLEIAEQGARVTGSEYLGAMATRMSMGQRMGVFHETYDLLLTPAMPIAAFEAGVEVPAGSGLTRWTGWTPFTYPFNMTQQPAASVPCGLTSAGLPAGLQIVGPRHADALVLAAARAYEQANPWPFPRL